MGGLLEQRRPMSLVETWGCPPVLAVCFGRHHIEENNPAISRRTHSNQLQGHNTGMLSKQRHVWKSSCLLCLFEGIASVCR